MAERKPSWSGSEYSALYSQSPLSSPSLKNASTPQSSFMSSFQSDITPVSYDCPDPHQQAMFVKQYSGDIDEDEDFDDKSGISNVSRKDVHTLNEQKRRDIIKSGYSTLERIVPTCKPNPGSTRLSRATVLMKTADYVAYLEEQKKKQAVKLEELRKEVKTLEIMKENYEQIVRAQSQQVRGMGGVMRSSQQIPNDIKFKLFEGIMNQLFQSFDSLVSMETFDQLSSCVISWIEEYCSPKNSHKITLEELNRLGVLKYTHSSHVTN